MSPPKPSRRRTACSASFAEISYMKYRLVPLSLICASVLFAQQPPAQQLTDEQKQKVDAALPKKAPAKPRKARRILVTNLAKVGDRLVRGHPSIPAANYAIERMGKVTGA